MKSSLQACTESYFRHAYAARRKPKFDKHVVQSLVIISHVPNLKIGRAALKVLRDMRVTAVDTEGSAA